MTPSGRRWAKPRITAQHWHYGVLVLLVLLNLTLAVRLMFAWNRAQQGDTARIEARQAEYRAMQLKTRPLRGLDKKIQQAQLDQQSFYAKRFPATDSEVLRSWERWQSRITCCWHAGNMPTASPTRALLSFAWMSASVEITRPLSVSSMDWSAIESSF